MDQRQILELILPKSENKDPAPVAVAKVICEFLDDHVRGNYEHMRELLLPNARIQSLVAKKRTVDSNEYVAILSANTPSITIHSIEDSYVEVAENSATVNMEIAFLQDNTRIVGPFRMHFELLRDKGRWRICERIFVGTIE